VILYLFMFIYCVSLLDTIHNRKECLEHLKRERETPSKRKIVRFLYVGSENKRSLCENRRDHDI
jgi:hypothetical protein